MAERKDKEKGSGLVSDTEEISWSDDEAQSGRANLLEPFRDDISENLLPSKAHTTTETTELTIGSDGPHTPTDMMSRGESPNLLDMDDGAEATGELRSILAQQCPATPSASSTTSRRMSYSFSRKPTPEPELPFDFNRFQEQLKVPSAAPVAKYMKSFLTEFSKRQWNRSEQQKIVHDFLEFIRGKMLVYEPFKSASEAEFDNAHEGMEKLILNRLYPNLFPPLVVSKVGKTAAQKTGHLEDVDRDKILNNKIKIYSWVRESHLDIPVGPLNERFVGLAGIELNKLDQFRAPRDKIICILNCCKVIFGLLRSLGNDESADKFVPFLILTLLTANVSNLCSHVSFIEAYRNPSKLSGESGYYLSSLQGAINFVEVLDRQSLTVSDEEYEANVEKSVRRIKLEDSIVPPSPATPVAPSMSRATLQLPSKDLVFEKATGLLNIAKPSLTAVGRLFSQEGTSADDTIPDRELRRGSYSGSGDNSNPPRKSQAPRSYIESGEFGGVDQSDYDHNDRPRYSLSRPSFGKRQTGSLSGATQGRAESYGTNNTRGGMPLSISTGSRVEISEEEARAANTKERQSTVNTLSAMFENVEIGVIEMVLDEKRGKVGASIDALLEIGGP